MPTSIKSGHELLPVPARRCASPVAPVRPPTRRSKNLPKPPRNPQNLLDKPMRCMPIMLKRVAVWAQHFKVAEIVVFAVSIFVVNAKNFRVFCIPTPNAFGQHSPHHHVFAHCGEVWFPFGLVRFVDTCLGAVFALGRRRIQECSSAMHTFVLNRSFSVHGLVVALRTTVFGLVCATGNVRKNAAAFKAICPNLRSCRQRHARSAAILRRVFSVFRHREICATMFARNCVTHSGA